MVSLKSDELVLLNDLIYSINAISDECVMRKHFLDTLGCLIPYYSATFYLTDITHDNPLVRLVDVNMEDDKRISYEKYYYKLDYSRKFTLVRNSIVFNETRIFDEKEREKTEYYNDYLRPNVHFMSSVFLANQDGLLGNINLSRRRADGDFCDKDLFILNMLSLHLTNRLDQMKQQNALARSCKIADITPYSAAYHLTNREAEILNLMMHGHSNSDISTKLYISIDTVKKHVGNIFAKLGISSRVQLIGLFNEQPAK